MSGMFGNDEPQTTTTQSLPSPGAQKVMDMAMPFIQKFISSDPQYQARNTVPDFNQLQTAAQGQAVNQAMGAQTDLTGGLSGASQFLFGDVLSPDSNPHLRGYMDYASKPIQTNLLESVLPSIRREADTTGQFGSSRQALAEQGAFDTAARQYGDTRGAIANQAYGQGLDAMIKNIGLAPQTIDAQLAPARTLGAVGDSIFSQQQAKNQEQAYNDQMAQFWDLYLANELLGSASGFGGGTNIATGPSSRGTSLGQGALGGASIGASIGGPWGAAGGAGLGALLSLL